MSYDLPAGQVVEIDARELSIGLQPS
jgi:hypothetical protein